MKTQLRSSRVPDRVNAENTENANEEDPSKGGRDRPIGRLSAVGDGSLRRRPSSI
jgi:hypothetical protein